jgi:hypothetical protein
MDAIEFDFENNVLESYEKLEEILCTDHFADTLRAQGDAVGLFARALRCGVIQIEENAYALKGAFADASDESARRFADMLGKRGVGPEIYEIKALFDVEAAVPTGRPYNAAFFPETGLYLRLGGITAYNAVVLLNKPDCRALQIYKTIYAGEKFGKFYEIKLLDKKKFGDLRRKREDALSCALDERIWRETVNVDEIADKLAEEILPQVEGALWEKRAQRALKWFEEGVRSGELANALANYLFLTGPAERLRQNGTLSEADAAEINKYMVNHIAGLLIYAARAEWPKLRAALKRYAVKDGEKVAPELEKIRGAAEANLLDAIREVE